MSQVEKVEHRFASRYFVHYGHRVMCKCGHRATGYNLGVALMNHQDHVEQATTPSKEESS